MKNLAEYFIHRKHSIGISHYYSWPPSIKAPYLFLVFQAKDFNMIQLMVIFKMEY